MPNLHQVLAQVRKRIDQNRGKRSMNEQNTKATLVEPVLRALGWDTEDVEEVAREYKRKRADKPVDYALLELRTPRLFVEAKALGMHLDDRKWASQIMGYASVAGVEWIVLTDGDEYRIYNSHATVAVEEKIFRTIRITDEGSLAEETLGLLSKEQMSENRIKVLWKVQFVDRKVKAAVEDLFGPEIDSSLVRLVKKRIQNLPTRDIKSSLCRARVNLDFPMGVDLPLSRPEEDLGEKPAARFSPTSRKLHLDLKKAGLIRLPLKLERTYRGNLLTATIETDGSIVFAGEQYDSLSAAAGKAKQSILGSARPPATNGWKFWQFRDTDGKLQKVEVLRRKYRERKKGR